MYTYTYIYILYIKSLNCIIYIVEDPQNRGQEDPSTGPAFWPFTALRNSDLASVGTSLAKLTAEIITFVPK